ncbi:hypothetical protein V9T40_000942 [Parthenolecanium corni]|uniref:G-protein coupled receptors family 3 profile domain-containing protein n=1 Tax=Parthenolecanium corni TaxID=536013 RepID=A0AAN9TAA5_9HEMI
MRYEDANYSRLEMSTEFFMIPVSVVHNSPVTEIEPTSSISVLRSPVPYQSSFFRREIWVPPLLVLSVLSMVLIVLFEIFVLCKTWKTVPSRRHLFLGQMLLSGLFVCSAVSLALMTEPTTITCAIVRFGIGFGYCLIFSTLLVKCVFLISLNGGVYLPAPYQALLLFFAVAIQIAINVQWLINTPPNLIQGNFLYPVCQVPYQHVLFSLVYVVILIMIVTVLSIKSRTIRDNYREAMFIAITMCCIIPVWFGWVISGLMALEKNRDACLAFGLSITSITVFLIMFMPKSRQLAAMGRDGMYIEDGEEKFSTISRVVSPSFFHLKPVKPVHTSSKHQASVINPFADRIALVATPPSYAHHYYPCCYFAAPHANGNPILDGNMYTTGEPTLSNNPNVFFHRNGIHPGLMY